MRISIRHNNECIVEFDQIHLSGRKALGGYAFNFTLKGNAGPRVTEINVSNINLSLSSEKSGLPLVTSVLSTTQIQTYRYPGQNEQLHFEVILSPGQVIAIEEYRQDKDLDLQIALRATTQLNNASWGSFEISELKISRQEWLNALKQTGYQNTLLFEIPLPRSETNAEKLIIKAQGFIETGHYKDAVMQCRHIIDQIEILRDDKQLAINASKKLISRPEREAMTAIERMYGLREQLKNVCHLGAHGSEEFTRSQAKAVLGMTMALLAEPTVGFYDQKMLAESGEA